MGEYAKRISDGQEIKIGTCEEMFYLRYDDRFKITGLPGNVDPSINATGLFFRLPFPDEDGIRPGEYGNHLRGLRLSKPIQCSWCKGSGQSGFETNGQCRRCHGSGIEGHEEFSKPEMVNNPGTIQLTHKSGLLLNVPCYHGLKLPDVAPPMKAFWNGKESSIELSSLKVMKSEFGLRDEVWPVVHCVHCRIAWRYEWADVWDYIDGEMQSRLAPYFPDVGLYTSRTTA